MEISIWLVLVACVACFLAGIMNASGGSGGLLSVPALMLCGLDPHWAIGTNKVQATMGLFVAIGRYERNGFLDWRLVIPCALCGAGGAVLGSKVSLLVSNQVLMYCMFALLPLCAWAVLSGKGVDETRPEGVTVTKKLVLTMAAIAFCCGFYDGFYGPGSGTFLIVALGIFTPLGVKTASAHAKVINFSDNIAALIVFLINGRVLVWLGLLAGACGMIGAWVGAGAVIKDGSRIMKPLLLLALVLLVINLVTEL